MKKPLIFLLLCLLALSVTGVAAGAYSSCVDADRDYWCDDCGLRIPHTCIDTNKDTWCDKCDCWIPHTCADKDGDHECDQCGKVMNVNINITVSSYLSDDQNIHLTFCEGTYPSIFANLYGSPVTHTFSCAANSRFQLVVNKYGHPPMTFSHNTYHDDINIYADLYPYGDVSQDGRVNVGDVAKIYAHVRDTAWIDEDYAQMCADASGDGKINMGDAGKVYAHIRGSKKLF